jgi:hypothetical protein
VRSGTIISALLMCAVAVPAESRQSLDDYLALLTRYARDPDGAVQFLTTTPSWNRRSIEDDVKVCMKVTAAFGGDASPCDTRRRALSAMLHAEAAMRLSNTDTPGAAFHFTMSRRVGAYVKDRPAFSEKWYELLTMMRLSEGDTIGARDVAFEAKNRLDHSAVGLFLNGVISEVSTMFDFKNLRDPLPPYDRQSQRIRAGMSSATRDYVSALAIDPAFARARLRLGWTLTVLEEPGAEPALIAAGESTDRSTRYLSRLFLGSLAARRGQLDRALDLYRAARDEGPGFQSACVAVSQTLHALGSQSQSEAIAAQCLTMADDDPWWLYRAGGVEASLIVELRREAARP